MSQASLSWERVLIRSCLAVAALLLFGGTHLAQANTPSDPLSLRASCSGNQGTVPGTNGIYSLRTRQVSCPTARRVVLKFHTKQVATGKRALRAKGFACRSNFTGGGEGLMVKCRRGIRRVAWTAYLDSSVRAIRTCGNAGADYPDTEGGSVVRITKTVRISCRGAKRVMRACIRSYRMPRGWRSGGGTNTGGYILVRGRKQIWWKGIAGGAPHCFSERP